MICHGSIKDSDVRALIKKRHINFAGNSKLRIFGRLDCSSGKRMKRQNRVFFGSITEAIRAGYRPCGNCMNEAYKKWKNEFV